MDDKDLKFELQQKILISICIFLAAAGLICAVLTTLEVVRSEIMLPIVTILCYLFAIVQNRAKWKQNPIFSSFIIIFWVGILVSVL